MIRISYLWALLLTYPLIAGETKWATFSIGPVLFIQNEETSFFSFLSYTPRYSFSEAGYLRLNLGASLLRQNNRSYPLFETALLAGWRFTENLGIELGGGSQYVKEKIVPSLSTNFVWHLSQRILLIRRFLIGYTAAFVPKEVLHEIRLAAGVDFGN